MTHADTERDSRSTFLIKSVATVVRGRRKIGSNHEANRHNFFFGVLVLVNVNILSVHCEGLLLDFVSYDESKVSNISELCERECQQLKQALHNNEIWALKVNDASGRKSIEYFWGNNYFLGSEFACKLLNDPPQIYLVPSENRIMDKETLTIKPEFPVEYRVIYYTHNSPLQFNAEMFNRSILHVGLCLPQSCSNFDLKILSNSMIEKSFSNRKMFGDVKFVSSKRLVLRSNPLDNYFVSSFM